MNDYCAVETTKKSWEPADGPRKPNVIMAFDELKANQYETLDMLARIGNMLSGEVHQAPETLAPDCFLTDMIEAKEKSHEILLAAKSILDTLGGTK